MMMPWNGPGVDLIKLFLSKFANTFLKVRPFYKHTQNCCITMKRCSLQRTLVNLRKKSFMRLTPVVKSFMTSVHGWQQKERNF
jgi:hypothetical protein